jgi:accessory gene regulator B
MEEKKVMVYEKTIRFLTGYIAGELNLTGSRKDRVRYGLEVLISALISLVITLAIAHFLGIFYSAFFILISGAILKTFSGGTHLKTFFECSFFTALIINCLALLNLSLSEIIFNVWPYYLICTTFFTLFSLFLYSPADVPEKPIRDPLQKQRLRLISILITMILIISVTLLFLLYQQRYLILNTSIITGLFFQSLIITPLAYRLIKSYYIIKIRILDSTKRKGVKE